MRPLGPLRCKRKEKRLFGTRLFRHTAKVQAVFGHSSRRTRLKAGQLKAQLLQLLSQGRGSRQPGWSGRIDGIADDDLSFQIGAGSQHHFRRQKLCAGAALYPSTSRFSIKSRVTSI